MGPKVRGEKQSRSRGCTRGRKARSPAGSQPVSPGPESRCSSSGGETKRTSPGGKRKPSKNPMQPSKKAMSSIPAADGASVRAEEPPVQHPVEEPPVQHPPDEPPVQHPAAKPTKPKKERQRAELSDEQEDEMFEWLEQTPAIYNMRDRGFKTREALWEAQAGRMGPDMLGKVMTAQTLQLWFKSQRSTFTRLKKDEGKSGRGVSKFDPARDGTVREKEIWQKLLFIKPYIHEATRHPLKSVSTQKLLFFFSFFCF